VIVAAVERFTDPSRRCNSARVGGAGDQVVAWDLPSPLEQPLTYLKEVPGAVTAWLALPAPERRALLNACLETGGARAGALLRAPELLRRVRSREVDAVAMFSAKDFGLGRHLAEAASVDRRVLLERGTQYFGEFAFELLAVVPYAYWLHHQGRLDFTVSTADTRCLYYFSEHHEERSLPRSYVPITEYPLGERGSSFRYDRKAFPTALDTTRWLPPPYKSVYTDGRFRWSREVCIVCNKYSDEQYLWYRGPANFIDTATVLQMIGRLRERYQVIYVRPRKEDIVNDHQTIHDSDDIDAVTRAYPDVLTIQQLQAEHPDLSFNELQLRLFAGCERFVSVLGGSSYLASYFGGTNVVFARRGWEVACGAYERWFHLFSGARVVRTASPQALLRAVGSELMGASARRGGEVAR
jgi:hypothetical protein